MSSMGWTMGFILIASALGRMLGVSCYVCNIPLCLRSFNNLIWYSSVSSCCVLRETTSASVNDSLMQFLYGLCVHSVFWPFHSGLCNCYRDLLMEYTHLSHFTTHIRCTCNYTPQNDVLALEPSLGIRDWTCFHGTPLHRVDIPS